MDLPSGTVTFLFTDIEGSTRLWEQHPQAMAGALARHDAIMRQAIAAAGRRGLQGDRRCLPGRVSHRAGGLRRCAGGPARAGQRSVGRGRRGAGAHGAAHLRGRAERWRLPHRCAQPPRALAGRGSRRADRALAQHGRSGARDLAARRDAARPGRAPPARSRAPSRSSSSSRPTCPPTSRRSRRSTAHRTTCRRSPPR